MNITKYWHITFSGLLLLAAAMPQPASAGINGPEHRTLRPLAMGNAFVAVVDDKDALHYNPAGLNLINRLGNKKRRPEMGYYPSNMMDMRMDFLGLGLPFGTAYDLMGLYQDHKQAFAGTLEDLQNDPTLVDDMVQFDRVPLPVSVMTGGELAFHNFGMSYWGDVTLAPFIDMGVVLPQAGIQELRADIAMEIGIARSFMHQRLSVGLEYRLAFREIIEGIQLSAGDLMDQNALAKIMSDSLNSRLHYLTDLGRLGHGFDIGFLWQQTRTIRFGAAVQNLFMNLNDEAVIPEYTIGVVWSPIPFQNNFRWKRKINFALDYEDIFNTERGFLPMSKLNFGAEWEQTLIPYILKGRLASGFKGGYWTAGFGGELFTLLHYDFATWAEEGGYFTGQKEDRNYVMKFGIGF